MKTFMLMTANGPIVILTTHAEIAAPDLLRELRAKGIAKFLSCEIPLDLARARYGGHFFVVEHYLREMEDVRILDQDGAHVFSLFRFEELGRPVACEADEEAPVSHSEG